MSRSAPTALEGITELVYPMVASIAEADGIAPVNTVTTLVIDRTWRMVINGSAMRRPGCRPEGLEAQRVELDAFELGIWRNLDFYCVLRPAMNGRAMAETTVRKGAHFVPDQRELRVALERRLGQARTKAKGGI